MLDIIKQLEQEVNNIYKQNYDIITTPEKIAQEMVDMLPEEVFNPETKFLDPVCKTGIFLYLIKTKLVNSPTMQEKFPDKNTRIKHIEEHQLYGIAQEELCIFMSEKKIYGVSKSLIGQPSNIVSIANYKLNIKNKDYIKNSIKKEFGELKFDVIIGNPPYQDKTQTIYQHFIEVSIELSQQYTLMIVKGNWLTSNTLENTRKNMLKSGLIEVINYPQHGEVFNNASVAVNIFMINKYDMSDKLRYKEVVNSAIISDYTLKRDSINLILSEKLENEIVFKLGVGSNFSRHVLPQEAFRVTSDFNVGRGTNKYSLDTSDARSAEYNVSVAYLNGQKLSYKYCKEDDIPNRKELVRDYKVVSGARFSKNKNTVTNINAVNKDSIVASSLGVLYTSRDKCKAISAYKYINTRFFRFLVNIICESGMTNLSPYRFSLIPDQEFTSNSTINWNTFPNGTKQEQVADIDRQLYQKYNLTQEEIEYIESTINPMK